MGEHGAIGGTERPLRVALFADADRVTRRLAQTLGQIGEHGVPGCELEVLTAPNQLAAAAYDLVHALTAGPAAAAAMRHGIPVIAAYDPTAPAGFYEPCDAILSPSATADASLPAHHRIVRWRTGVDVRTFHPARFAPDAVPGAAFNLLHIGDPSEEAHDAFMLARARNPRLRLVLADNEGDSETLAAMYASADLLLVSDATDPFGDTVLEAHASGLPVLAVDTGAAAELIENGRTGCLVAPAPVAIAAAIVGLARRATLLERLATGGLRATSERSWQCSLAQLAGAYELSLRAPAEPVTRAAA